MRDVAVAGPLCIFLKRQVVHLYVTETGSQFFFIHLQYRISNIDDSVEKIIMLL